MGGVQLVASLGPDTAAALAAAPSLEEGKVGKGVICIRHFGAFPEIFFFFVAVSHLSLTSDPK